MIIPKLEIEIKGQCKLCRNDSVPLHGESHIIPKFMFRRIKCKDATSKYYVFDKTNQKYIELKNGKGVFERNIFCKECEGKLSLLNDYGARILGSYNLSKVTTKVNVTSFGEYSAEYMGLEYDKLKLFILSLFVRASLCKRPEVNLKFSERDEKSISDMIVNNQPGKSLEYPVRIQFYRKRDNARYINFPMQINTDEYAFFYSDRNIQGVWLSLNTNGETVRPIAFVLLKEDGSILSPVLDDEKRDFFYKNILKVPEFKPDKNNTIKFKL